MFGNLTLASTLVILPAHAWANDCPEPIVAYSLSIDGKDYETEAKVGNFTGDRLGILANHLVNRLILENADGIRWASSAYGIDDTDFSLVVTEISSEDTQTLSYQIADQKGRNVLAQPGQSISHDAIAPGQLDALTEALASVARPLFRKLRAHQVRIREAETSAIHAVLNFSPPESTIAPGKSLPLTARLADCDEDHPPLSGRPVEFTVQGPGKLDPLKGNTDAAGEIALT